MSCLKTGEGLILHLPGSTPVCGSWPESATGWGWAWELGGDVRTPGLRFPDSNHFTALPFRGNRLGLSVWASVKIHAC